VLLAAAVALLAAAGCGGEPELREPDEGAVRQVLRAVLAEPRAPLEELPLAGADLVDDEVRYRDATERELGRLFLPPPAEDVVIEAMQSRFYPAWQVLFHRVVDGERGAPLRADVVELEGALHVLVNWWPAMRLDGGDVRPDFRPNPKGESEVGYVTVAARPPWVRLPYPIGYEPR
jgi:hypothetical protein